MGVVASREWSREAEAEGGASKALDAACVRERWRERRGRPTQSAPARSTLARTHGLLAHGALVGVAGRLVVVWEGHDGGADAQNHGRVDLAVRVLRDAAGVAIAANCGRWQGWWWWRW